jgi:hypothetical protein
MFIYAGCRTKLQLTSGGFAKFQKGIERSEDFFFGILQSRSCAKGDRRENFVQLRWSRRSLCRRRPEGAFCTTREYTQ